MEIQRAGATIDWGTLLAAERGRLVGLCRYLAGDDEAAEDLAQETLVEAWRHAQKLHDPSGLAAWLGAIAHNVCRRWARRQGRDLAQQASPAVAESGEHAAAEEHAGAALDVEIELERDELAALLDRALAVLPPATRTVLIARYIQDSPLAEVAARLGISEAAATMKLQRGKLALRQVLTTDFRDEARSYGLVPAGQDDWQETRIWCWRCGQRRLIGRYTGQQPQGIYQLKCPYCCTLHGWGLNAACGDVAFFAPVFGAVTAYKPLLSRLMTHSHRWWTHALASHCLTCLYCGQETPMRLGQVPGIPPSLQQESGFYAYCAQCASTPNESLAGLVMSSPEGRRFWREHTRVRLLPEREVEAEGRPALIISVESLGDTAQLDAVADRATFALLHIHGAPSA